MDGRAMNGETPRKIGSVIYDKNRDTGELSAKWNIRQGESVHWGTGRATGPAGPAFLGEYEITYDYKGKKQGPFRLVISEQD